MKSATICFNSNLITIRYTSVIFNKTIQKYQYLLNNLEVAVSDVKLQEYELNYNKYTLKELFWKDIEHFEDLYYRIILLLAPPFVVFFIIWLFYGIVMSSN